MNDPRGSLWRVWDLHFHTPSSYDYRDKSVTDQQLIDGLLKAEVSAVAITDHNKIDVARIESLRNLAGGKLTFFPGIELRTELGGASKVHIIGIFRDDCDIDDTSVKLAGQLGITRADLEKDGEENVFVEFVRACEVIKGLEGLISVHAGSKSNSIEGLVNAQKINRIIKTKYAADYIDIYEIGSAKDIDGYKNIVFPAIGKHLPLVLGSDNHNIRNYDVKERCWIKADPTFLGLRQVITEPGERVFVGDRPDKLKLVDANKSRFLRRVEIRKVEDSKLLEHWFDADIQLNHDLVAIIGSKGSGKSALADVIGHLGDTTRHDDFSFLSPGRFRIPKQNLAQHFRGCLTWMSDVTREKLLSERPNSGELEAVKLIPQSYLEKVCNTVGTREKSVFDHELEDVIFSHVGSADRYGCGTLADLLDHTTVERKQEIEILIDDLRKVNNDIARVERKSQPEYRSRIEKLRKLREDELANLDAVKPSEVKKPESNDAPSEDVTKSLKSIESRQEQLEELEKRISLITAELERYSRQKSAATKVKEKVENLRRQYNRFKDDCEFELSLLAPLKVDDLVTFEVDYAKLNERIADIEDSESKMKPALSEEDSQNSLVLKKRTLESEIANLREKLDEPNRNYQKYIEQLETWKKQRTSIVGDSDTADTLEFVKNELLGLNTIHEDIERLYEKRKGCIEGIFRAKKKLSDSYRRVHRPVQHFIETHETAQRDLGLQFQVKMTDIGFERTFWGLVDQRRAGTFGGGEEGRNMLRNMLSAVDFDDEVETVDFATKVLAALRVNQRASAEKPMNPEDQLKAEVGLEDVYNAVCSLEFLEPRYSLELRGKPLNQLSPGEKGTLLVIFYLLVDKRNIPLLIDQPEENLDSETVFRTLVPCIREAKKRRQIILVTHNPNLAVVCDAEQVIYASMEKKDGNRINYQSGAIENPSINRRLSDVLEGTLGAFRRRDAKYVG